MKKHDLVWVESLARHACGRPLKQRENGQTVLNEVQEFCFELCTIINDYATHFNELVQASKPDAVVRVFRLGNNKAGLMLLRGRDKLVIAAEPPRIRARIVQVFAYGEHAIEALEFEAQCDTAGDVGWVSLADGQRVTPELVARYYLSPFLASGCKAYTRTSEPLMQSARV